MRGLRPTVALLVLTSVVAPALAACSGGDGDDGATVTVGSADPGEPGRTVSPSDGGADAAGDPSAPGGGAATAATGVPTGGAPTSGAPVTIAPEPTGVPGLDSDDAFCAAWSRFGGSWQVLVVGSTFLDDPTTVARWEIAASPVIADAYTVLVAELPDELAPEATDVADGYFGVLARRAELAAAALADAGATDSQRAALAEAWEAALAARDPSAPEIAFEVPPETAEVVAAAAEALQAQRVPIHLDPSMVVAVETPLTDAYLETACPDQGTLTGQEDGP